MSLGVMFSLSLSSKRWFCEISPMERKVMPPISPILRALGNVVGHGEDLIAVLVEEEVVVAKVWAAHVPVEIFGFDVKRKGIGEQPTELGGNLVDALTDEVSRDFVGRALAIFCLDCFCSCHVFFFFGY
jgi:hypothetical protein